VAPATLRILGPVAPPIVTLGDPRLRLPGERVRVFDKQLHRLLEDLLASMREVHGVGLAAQQIGIALQACVIEIGGDIHELVNPRITHLSGEQEDLEGCLSIPGFYAYRKRAAKAVVEAQNRHGRKIRLSGTGLLARAIQHETDHLRGELYIDQLGPDLELIPAEEIMARQEAASAGSAGDGEAPAPVE
jgi:peptide deformylase